MFSKATDCATLYFEKLQGMELFTALEACNRVLMYSGAYTRSVLRIIILFENCL